MSSKTVIHKFKYISYFVILVCFALAFLGNPFPFDHSSLLTLISFHLTGSISYTILDGRCLRSHPSVFYTSTIKLHRNLYSLTSSEEFEKKLDLCSYLSLIFSPFLPSLLILIHLSSSSLPCSLISLRHHLKTLFPLSVSLI